MIQTEDMILNCAAITEEDYPVNGNGRAWIEFDARVR